MSWDVALVCTTTNAESIEKIDDTNRKVFDLDTVVKELETHLEGIEQAELTWLDYESGDYAISFQLAPEEIILYIHILSDNGESAVMTLIKDLCMWLDCSAIDRTENEFIVRQG